MPQLLSSSTDLNALQGYIGEMKKERGFSNNKDHALINLTRQVGSLASAVKENWGSEENSETNRKAIAQEIADILIFTLDIANQYEISAMTALSDREAVNSTRQWTTSNRA